MRLIFRTVKEDAEGFCVDSSDGNRYFQNESRNISRGYFIGDQHSIKSAFVSDTLTIALVRDASDDFVAIERTSLWFFDKDLAFIANALEGLPTSLVQQFVTGLLTVSWLSETHDEWPDEGEIVKSGVYKTFSDLIYRAFSSISSDIIIKIDESTSDVAGTRNALTSDIEMFQEKALLNRVFRIPFGDNTNEWIDFRHSIYIDELRTAYLRFDGGSLSHVTMMGPHHSSLNGIWSTEEKKIYCMAYMHADIQYALPEVMLKLIRWAKKIQLNAKRSPNATFLPVQISHLGHHLVNELTGFAKLAKVDPAALNRVVLVKVGLGEPFGPVEDICPILWNVPAITCESISQFERLLFATNSFCVRLTSNYISRELATSVSAACENQVRGSGSDLLRFDEPRKSGERRVVLGLRVENRTWEDQASRLIECIRYLQPLYETLVVVIDGHNSTGKDPLKIYSSFSGTGNADDATVEAELRILSEIRAAFAGEDGVEVVSLIQRSVPDNIFVLNRCDYFIAPWGAGLAKYKWICDMDGVVLTSRWNLEQRPDLRIYEAGGLREAAKTSLYLGADAIEDLPDSPRLIDNWGHPSFWNFRVLDMSGLFALISEVDGRVGSFETPSR